VPQLQSYRIDLFRWHRFFSISETIDSENGRPHRYRHHHTLQKLQVSWRLGMFHPFLTLSTNIAYWLPTLDVNKQSLMNIITGHKGLYQPLIYAQHKQKKRKQIIQTQLLQHHKLRHICSKLHLKYTCTEFTVGSGRQKPNVVCKRFGNVVGQLQLDVRIAVEFQHRRGVQHHRRLNG